MSSRRETIMVRRSKGSVEKNNRTGEETSNLVHGTPTHHGLFLDTSSEKEAEKVFGSNKTWFWTIFEDSPIGIEIFDARGTLIGINRACLDIFGVTDMDEIGGFNFFNDAKITQGAKELLRKGEIARFSISYDLEQPEITDHFTPTKKGTLYLDIINTPLKSDSTSEVKGYLVQIVDSTFRQTGEKERIALQRKFQQANVALQAAIQELRTQKKELQDTLEKLSYQQKKFGHILSSMDDFVYILDREGTCLYANPAVSQFAHLDSEEFLGKTFVKEWPHHNIRLETVEQFNQDLHEAFQTERKISGENVFHLSSGRKWFSYIIHPVRDEQGEVNSVLVTSRDVTEHKQAEAALRGSEEKYRRLFEEDLTADVITTPEGRILACNPAFAAVFGFASVEETMRTNILETYPFPDDRRMFLEILKREGKVENFTRVRRRRDGALIHVVESVIGRFDDRGELIEIQGYLYDDSERVRAEGELRANLQALKRSNEDLERFAYVASHDLQEPLRNIVSFSQLLARRYSGTLGPDADEYIGFIVEAGKRMQNLITDLLEFSRVSTRGKALEPTDTERVLEEAVKTLWITIETENATVTHDSLPVVKGDASQLVQVFQNLIGNALKFRREEPPWIHISAQKTDGMWQFSVRDNGIGIPPEQQERIFVIFQRLHTREKYPGTGVGLAIVKRIIERHRGSIWVESEEGKGSTFFFTLPDV
jgi:PAS domain S-box-containing protein